MNFDSGPPMPTKTCHVSDFTNVSASRPSPICMKPCLPGPLGLHGLCSMFGQRYPSTFHSRATSEADSVTLYVEQVVRSSSERYNQRKTMYLTIRDCLLPPSTFVNKVREKKLVETPSGMCTCRAGKSSKTDLRRDGRGEEYLVRSSGTFSFCVFFDL